MQFPAAETTRELTPGEQLMVWATRVWVTHFKQGKPPCAGFGRGFAAAGVPHAADNLDRLMHLVGRHAQRSIDIRCVHCRMLSDDESGWLHAIASLQRGDVGPARDTLSGYVEPSVLSAVCVIMAQIALALATVDLRLPLRPAPNAAEAPQAPSSSSCPDVGLSLVH